MDPVSRELLSLVINTIFLLRSICEIGLDCKHVGLFDLIGEIVTNFITYYGIVEKNKNNTSNEFSLNFFYNVTKYHFHFHRMLFVSDKRI